MFNVQRNERLVTLTLPFILIILLLLLLFAGLQVDHQRLREEFAPTPALAPVP